MSEVSCWWIEGGKCYIEPCARQKDGISKTFCKGKCVGYKNKREVLSQFFPTEDLIIISEHNKHTGVSK